jgi:hypothetical protein
MRGTILRLAQARRCVGSLCGASSKSFSLLSASLEQTSLTCCSRFQVRVYLSCIHVFIVYCVFSGQRRDAVPPPPPHTHTSLTCCSRFQVRVYLSCIHVFVVYRVFSGQRRDAVPHTHADIHTHTPTHKLTRHTRYDTCRIRVYPGQLAARRSQRRGRRTGKPLEPEQRPQGGCYRPQQATARVPSSTHPTNPHRSLHASSPRPSHVEPRATICASTACKRLNRRRSWCAATSGRPTAIRPKPVLSIRQRVSAEFLSHADVHCALPGLLWPGICWVASSV